LDDHAAQIAIEALSTHKEEPQRMKWVRASVQKMPPPLADRKRLNIKYKGEPDLLVCRDGLWFWYADTDQYSMQNRVHNHSWSAIEWLDESESSDAGQSSNVKEERL
jgi:hypothetical protein